MIDFGEILKDLALILVFFTVACAAMALALMTLGVVPWP